MIEPSQPIPEAPRPARVDAAPQARPAAPVVEAPVAPPAASGHTTQADIDWLYSGDTSAAVAYSPRRAAAAPVPEVYDDYPVDDGYQQDVYADEAYADDAYEDAAFYDEPVPPRPPSRPKPRKRSVGRSIAQWTAVAVAAILVIVMGMGLYFLKRASDTLSNVSGEDCGLACALGEAGNVAGLGNSNAKLKTDSSGRTNVLILGTSEDRWDGEKGSGNYLTDSIMIVSVSEADQNAYMISIPRDLYIAYPKACMAGYQGKINGLYQCMGGDAKTVSGNRAALTATIPTFAQITGLQIQYAVNINYTVLVSLVNAVGGQIPVTINSDDPRGIYDRVTGAKVPNGTSNIDAVMTLNLARSRNSEGGYGMGSSNFAREQVQQAIVRGLMQQAQSNGFLTNMSGVSTALRGIGDNLRTTLTTEELGAALKLAKSVPAGNFHSISLINAVPRVVGDALVGDQMVIMPSAGQNNYTGIQRYIRTCLTAGPMADENATVDVLNATGQSGLAASWKLKLKEGGFNVVGTGDYTPPTPSGEPSQTGAPSPTATSTGPVSVTLYQINDKPLTAAALAKQLGVQPIPGPVPGYKSPKGADFVVILGL